MTSPGRNVDHEQELTDAYADIGIACLVLWKSEVKTRPDDVRFAARAEVIRLSLILDMTPPSPVRVASRFLASSGLASELRSRFNSYLSGPFDAKGSADLAKWFKGNFNFNVSSTPRGGKALKDVAKKILWVLEITTKWGVDQGETYRATLEKDWAQLSSDLDKFVALFSSEGGRDVPVSKVVGDRTYLNLVGMTVDRFNEYIDALEAVFAEVKGWRRKAFDGGLKVALAGPDKFRGTAGGVYKSAEDTMYVRATPKVLKRTRGTYGAFDYIIIHELGHRYEYKHKLTVDFDKSEWATTPYSRKEGEAFAELFALSNFGMKGNWDEKISKKFDDLMSAAKTTQRGELPPHLKALLERA